MVGAGEARNYYMLTEFNMSHASQDRNMHYMLVMTPPNSFERLLDHGDLTLPGHWTDMTTPLSSINSSILIPITWAR